MPFYWYFLLCVYTKVSKSKAFRKNSDSCATVSARAKCNLHRAVNDQNWTFFIRITIFGSFTLGFLTGSLDQLLLRHSLPGIRFRPLESALPQSWISWNFSPIVWEGSQYQKAVLRLAFDRLTAGPIPPSQFKNARSDANTPVLGQRETPF